MRTPTVPPRNFQPITINHQLPAGHFRVFPWFPHSGSAFARLGLDRGKHVSRADWSSIPLEVSPNPSLMTSQFDSN